MPTLTPGWAVATRFPSSPDTGYSLIVCEIHAALGENTPWRNRFRVFRRQRPLLRATGQAEEEHQRGDTPIRFHESLSRLWVLFVVSTTGLASG